MRAPWLLGLIALTGCDESDDATVPDLTLTSPATADWSDGAVVVSGMVSDNVGVSSLTINGESVEPDADGSFSHTLNALPGVLAVVVRAEDDAGNSADARASVLVGERLDAAESLPDAMRLQLGPGALDGIADAIDPGSFEEPIDATIAVLDAPCGPVTVSAEWLSADIGMLDLVASDAGLLLSIPLSDLKIAMLAEGCGLVAQGAVVDPSVTVNSITALSVGMDGPEAHTVSAWSEMSGLRIEMGALSDDLADLGLSEELVGAVLSVTVAQQVSAALADLFSDLRIRERIVLVDHHIDIDAPLAGIDVSADGIALSIDASIQGSAEDPYGSLLLPQPDVLAPPVDDLSLSLPLNTLNRLLHNLWISDGLDLNEVNLDNILLAALFPEASDVRINLSPGLPPVISPSDDGAAMFAMDLPGVAMEITGRIGKRRSTLAAGHLSLSGGLDAVGEQGAGMTLRAMIDAVSLDLSQGADSTTERESLESSLEALLGLLAGQSMDLGTLPAPEITELPVGISGAVPNGEQHWISLEGRLR